MHQCLASGFDKKKKEKKVRKGAELGPVLLLTINTKPYMVSPIASLSPITSLLSTLSDLERSDSKPLRFRSLISRKRAKFIIRPYVTVKHQ